MARAAAAADAGHVVEPHDAVEERGQASRRG